MSPDRNEFSIAASPHYQQLSVALHGGAACMVMFSRIPLTPAVLVAALIIIAWTIDRRESMRARTCVVQRKFGIRWRVMASSAAEFGPATLVGGRVLPWMTCLRLRDDRGHMQSLCIPADAMTERQYRHLRVLAMEALQQ